MKRLAAVVAVLTGVACQPSAPPDTGFRATPVSIAPDVFETYGPAQYRQSYAKWGAEAVQGSIQQLREASAQAVALRQECDAVMLSDLSDRTAPPDAPEVFVDCENGSRWRYRLGDTIVSRPPDDRDVYG